MDRDLVMRAWNKAKGVIKKSMGSASDEAAGRVDDAKHDVQKAVGGEKDRLSGNP